MDVISPLWRMRVPGTLHSALRLGKNWSRTWLSPELLDQWVERDKLEWALLEFAQRGHRFSHPCGTQARALMLWRPSEDIPAVRVSYQGHAWSIQCKWWQERAEELGLGNSLTTWLVQPPSRSGIVKCPCCLEGKLHPLKMTSLTWQFCLCRQHTELPYLFEKMVHYCRNIPASLLVISEAKSFSPKYPWKGNVHQVSVDVKS